MYRPKEGQEELGNWKDPYTRALMVVPDLKLADKIVWYAYRFPLYFIKNKNYCEDILQEILIELTKIDFFEIYPHTISRIARKVVYQFLAKVTLPISGYRNYYSWLNRKAMLAKQRNIDEEVVTELEEAVKEIERIWNSQKEPDSVAKIILEKYNLIKEYIDSSLSKREFCKAKHIGEVRFNEELKKAKEEYIWLSSVIS